MVHRANLQLAMFQLAKDLGVDVVLGQGVREFDGKKARVVLESGRSVEGDLVVGADGMGNSLYSRLVYVCMYADPNRCEIGS